MNPDLPLEAAEFGEAAAKAFAALGGVDAARRAEADPARRRQAGEAVGALGADDLDPRSDLDTASAAGELCRAAGRAVLPYPVVALLLRDGDGRPLALAGGDRMRADHADLFGSWRVARLDGGAVEAAPSGPPLGSKLGPFVVDLRPSGGSPAAVPGDVHLHLTLTAWYLLGVVERCLELAVDHVTTRVQFGQTLSSFQAVQFQLADATVGVDGLRELCRFTLWRLFADPDRALPDALAVRLHALDVGRAVLRTTQQLHGAAGLCDEYDISVLLRHCQPALRLPFGSERTEAELATAVDRVGFASLFPHGARSAAAG